MTEVVAALALVIAVYELAMGMWGRARLRRVERRLGLHGDSRDDPS